MALAINTMGGHGLSNKVSCEHLPKETKGDAVLAVVSYQALLKWLKMNSKEKHFIYKSQ